MIKIAEEIDVCPMISFKFILLPRDNKLKMLEQIKQALFEVMIVRMLFGSIRRILSYDVK